MYLYRCLNGLRFRFRRHGFKFVVVMFYNRTSHLTLLRYTMAPFLFYDDSCNLYVSWQWIFLCIIVNYILWRLYFGRTPSPLNPGDGHSGPLCISCRQHAGTTPSPSNSDDGDSRPLCIPQSQLNINPTTATLADCIDFSVQEHIKAITRAELDKYQAIRNGLFIDNFNKTLDAIPI